MSGAIRASPASMDTLALTASDGEHRRGEEISAEEARLRVAIVIPARNEATTIGSVLRSIAVTLRGVPYRVFVCDDGSVDGTGGIALETGATVVRHSTALGIGAALATGFAAARAWGPDVFVQMDADGQHDPAMIPRLLEPILRCEADYVIGSRFLSGANGISPIRRVGVWFYSRLVSALGRFQITDVTSGFRAFRQGVYDRIRVRARKNWAVEVTLRAGMGGLRTVEVSTPFLRRNGGHSQFDVRWLFVLYHYRVVIQILRAIATYDPGDPPPISPRILRAKPDVLRSGFPQSLVDSVSRETHARVPPESPHPGMLGATIHRSEPFDDRWRSSTEL